MTALLNLDLYSMNTLLGLVWSMVIFYLLYTDKGAVISSSRWVIPLMLAGVYFSVPAVAAEVNALTQLSGGITTLDGHLFYTSVHVTEFADGLGLAGRLRYAEFQLGLDTLAPPAFAGFMLTVARSTISSMPVRRLVTVLVSLYFFSVLFANALMPVYMLNYPEQSSLSSTLYFLLPVLDGLKYGAHGVVWLVTLSSWAYSLANTRQRVSKTSETV